MAILLCLLVASASLVLSLGMPLCLAEETFMLEEIIVRSERQFTPEEALDIRDIRETPARDLGEALNAVDGVSFIRKGAIANDIVLRGFSRDNLSVLIDGARIHGACPNRMDPAPFHIDFAEIEEVTVLKGPYDVRNAGSLGGMVNAKTLTPKPGLHATIVTMLGSYENINTAANASYATDKADAIIGYAYKYSFPYKDGNGDRITEQYPDDSPNRYRAGEEDDKAYSMNTYWSKFGYNLLDNHRMELGYTRQEADDVAYPYLLMDAVFDDTNRVNWTYNITKPHPCIEKTMFQLYWNNVRHDMTDWRRVSSAGQARGYSMRTFAESETFGGKVGLEMSAGAGLLSFGADYYLTNWDTDTTLPTGTQDSVPDVDMSDMGAYLEYFCSFREKFSLTAAGRFDHAKTDADKNRGDVYIQYHGTEDTEKSDSFVSGNVQLNYTPREKIELFAGAGLSVRPPDAVERYFALVRPMTKPNWVGNPNLDPVENREIDLGVKYRGECVQGKVTFFYSDVKDYITVVNAMGTGGAKPAQSYKNVDATLYGGECTVQLVLPYRFFLKGGLGYTWSRDDTSEEPLAETPPLEANVTLRYDRESWFAELEGRFADRQDRVNSDLQEKETAGWGALNASAGGSYKRFSLVGGIQNIFDKQYFRHLSYQRDPFRSGIKVPEIGRSFFITLSCSL